MRDKNTILLEQAYFKVFESSHFKGIPPEKGESDRERKTYNDAEAYFDFQDIEYYATGDVEFVIGWGDNGPHPDHSVYEWTIDKEEVEDIIIYLIETQEHLDNGQDVSEPIHNPSPELLDFAKEKLIEVARERFENDDEYN